MEKQQCISLIEMYKNSKFLWHSKDKDYHNKDKREGAWQEMSETFNMEAEQLKSKMKSLMGTYRREKSREKKSRITASKSKSGDKNIYKSRWFAYKYFDFLSDRNTSKDKLDADSVEEPKDGNTAEWGPSAASIGNNAKTRGAAASELRTSTRIGRIRKRAGGTVNKKEDLISNMLKSSTQLSTDPYFSYGLHIGNELRKYDQHTLAQVKWAISDIIFQADTGTLNYAQKQHSPYGSNVSHFTEAASTPPSPRHFPTCEILPSEPTSPSTTGHFPATSKRDEGSDGIEWSEGEDFP